MRRFGSSVALVAVPIVAALTVAGLGAAHGTSTASSSYDDPYFCSSWIQTYGDSSLTPDDHHRCMLAIAETYINGEENSIPPDKILFDPEVSRYCLGSQPDHEPGNADSYRSQYPEPIKAITNRQWTVDGDQAFIVYDGFTTASMGTRDFLVSERLTMRNGLIWEILITAIKYSVAGAPPVPLAVC